MASVISGVKQEAEHEIKKRPFIRDLITKYMKDNIGMLSAYLAWSVLTSLVPIVVGLVAISGLLLRSASAQREVVSRLSQALQGVLTPSEIQALVHTSVQHTGLLFVIGILGALWGGSNVGGALSTAFQAIFEVGGRNFIKEKLIDIGMILVFTALMLIILASTTAGALLNKLFSGFPIPGVAQFVIGTAISLGAAFLLFTSIYLAFPNIQPRLRLANVWRGALTAAVMFEIVTYVFPIYTRFAHFSKNGALLGSILLLTAWIYFFSMITMIGAEVVAVGALREAEAQDQAVGPSTQDSVPQHEVLRGRKDGKPGRDNRSSPDRTPRRRAPAPTRHEATTRPGSSSYVSDQQVQRDPAFWFLAATPLLVATLAGVYELLTAGRRRAA